MTNINYKKSIVSLAFVGLLIVSLLFVGQAFARGQGSGAGGGGGGGGGEHQGGGEEPIQGNNLSFPAIATDGYLITPVASSSFATAYEGPYTGLSEDQLAILDGNTWYAQKTEENIWQAEYVTATRGAPLVIYGIDWGDNIEVVNPIVGNPFRIEVSLYDKPESTMFGYKMALLANPSSPDEVQGTDGTTYDSELVAVVSGKPDLVIQNITDICTADLEWSGDVWTLNGTSLDQDNVTFSAELNVGGKYVYGASQGGWRPESGGAYRITMYLPESDISLMNAVIGNYSDWLVSTTSIEEEEENGTATPVIDVLHNLTYVDVFATGAGGGKPGDTDADSIDPCATVIDDDPATTTDPGVIDEDESSGSSGGSSSSRRNSSTGIVAGVATSQFVTQSDIDLQRHTLQDSLELLNVEYAKLLTLIVNSDTEQTVIDLQKKAVQNQIQLVRSEHVKLLKMMMITRLQELVAKLQVPKEQ